MAFRKKWKSILKFNPDILIIQECENESKYKNSQIIPNYNEFIWIGENLNKGVGIFSFNHYHIEISKNHNIDFKYILPLKVTGEVELNLYAIWAMPNKKKRQERYIGQIWKAVNFYESELDEKSILIGDWNSNAKWNYKRKIGHHTNVTDLLKKHKIISVYHKLKNEEHGKETEQTLYLLKQKHNPFHLDYCFVSESMLNKDTSISIGKYQDWIKLSDHMPIIIDNLK